MTPPRSCVSPEGHFIVGIHSPAFRVENLRETDATAVLGRLPGGGTVENRINFPAGPVEEPSADRIYEIANPFPFRGTAFINSAWADPKAGRPEKVEIPGPPDCSLSGSLDAWQGDLDPADKNKLLACLPHALKLALAQASTDPRDLTALACQACTLIFDPASGSPIGMGFTAKKDGSPAPDIRQHDIFEVLVNNPHLPDEYKEAMVLRPGVQGSSEIIGEYRDGSAHVFEYLRRNSYIPWGHFAANMANDAVRYRAKELSPSDMTGIRHLYYQRVFVRLARQLGLSLPGSRRCLSPETLEELRLAVLNALSDSRPRDLNFTAALWGWNFGFGYAQSGHRLHASHQMIHQQNALIPRTVTDTDGNDYPCFSAGDMVWEFIEDFRAAHGVPFFGAYLDAVRGNQRTDGGKGGENSLVVYEDDHVILFVPKAQISEWELQLMTQKPVGNVLGADSRTRSALDHAMLLAARVLEHMGAKMITGVEFSGRFDRLDSDQHLLYSFIPKLPYAPGTFSEAQMRWISGCYPEDVAHACRRALTRMETL